MPSLTKNQNNRPVIVVTGGCGFIGSHTVLELLLANEGGDQGAAGGYDVVVVDNLCNSSEGAFPLFHLYLLFFQLAMCGMESDIAVDNS